MYLNNRFLGFLLLFLHGFIITYAQNYGKNGMVVSSNQIASEVGVEILKKGGNAIDASIATAFALAVTHPTAGNIGGGGFIVYKQQNGLATTIDFREKAPAAARVDMFTNKDGDLLENYRTTLAAVGTPGTVAGLYLAHQKYGKLPWKKLVQPAIDLAKKGFPMPWNIYSYGNYLKDSDDFEDSKFLFIKHYFDDANGNLVEPHDIWTQPELARTLKYIRDKGKDGFYKGTVAKEIAAFMAANGGLITEEDLLNYEAIERKPIEGYYKGFKVYSMPPPSSGGITLVQMLNMIEQADLNSIEFNSHEYVHIMAEVMRRAYANRAEYLGDPDLNPDMPIEKLISKDYAKALFDSIDLERASVSDSINFAQAYESEQTTHLSVVDKQGNAVSLTYTLEQGYGSKLGSPKLGFIFNNEMGDFNPKPGVTSGWMIGTQPNVIAPNKRMLSSMTPTILTKDDKPFMVIGTPGGRTIINTVFQTIVGAIGYKMPIEDAINVMKIHHQWMPDVIMYEKDLMSPDTRKILEEMGHTLNSRSNLGELMGILYSEELQAYFGASDVSSVNGGAIGF
ncbi:gamma-glutamyltransferase [Aegicerativicinus sediminis]|uniref:gamma-glutamyltransferase n=1 Tax=Aegicerativicinus sediminis TaxID=2893202 RepID=UPI001E5CE27F|nr:gamma-glutamyltransferase [Aegicerativicinus sediminis]